MDTEKIVEASVESIVGLIPAFAGLTGNPLWIAPATIIAPFIQKQINEVAQWSLGILQRKKVDCCTKLMSEAMAVKIKNGESPRKDSFFECKYNSQIETYESSASKLIEGALLKTKEEYDSKKIPFISFFTANVLFTPNLSESKAFVLLEILNKLTYRQLCALAIFHQRKILKIGAWESQLKAIIGLQDYYDVAYEFISLKDLLLIEQQMPNGRPGMGIGIQDYRISALGQELYITANLAAIDQQDLSTLNSMVDYVSSFMK